MVEAAGMCLSRLGAIQASFAACGSGPRLRRLRIGVQPATRRTASSRRLQWRSSEQGAEPRQYWRCEKGKTQFRRRQKGGQRPSMGALDPTRTGGRIGSAYWLVMPKQDEPLIARHGETRACGHQPGQLRPVLRPQALTGARWRSFFSGSRHEIGD